MKKNILLWFVVIIYCFGNQVFWLAFWKIHPITERYPIINSDILDRMHTKWFTRYSSLNDFRPNDYITRWEASKFILAFSELWYKYKTRRSDCSFNDIEFYDDTLVPSIIESCELWFFNWSKGNFMPNNNLSKAEAITILLRPVRNLSENFDPWRFNAFNIWNANWIIDETDLQWMTQPITRWELWLWVHRMENLSAINNMQWKIVWENMEITWWWVDDRFNSAKIKITANKKHMCYKQTWDLKECSKRNGVTIQIESLDLDIDDLNSEELLTQWVTFYEDRDYDVELCVDENSSYKARKWELCSRMRVWKLSANRSLF